MEMEVEQHVSAARHERTPERNGYRNGLLTYQVITRTEQIIILGLRDRRL